jgi:predicted RND superfamily exporter protein
LTTFLNLISSNLTKERKKLRKKEKKRKEKERKWGKIKKVLCSEASSQIPVIVVVLLMLMFDWGEEWHYDQDNSDLYFNKH